MKEGQVTFHSSHVMRYTLQYHLYVVNLARGVGLMKVPLDKFFSAVRLWDSDNHKGARAGMKMKIQIVAQVSHSRAY